MWWEEIPHSRTKLSEPKCRENGSKESGQQLVGWKISHLPGQVVQAVQGLEYHAKELGISLAAI